MHAHSWITPRLGGRNNNSGACGCRERERGDYSKGTSLAESAWRRGVFFMAARRAEGFFSSRVVA